MKFDIKQSKVLVADDSRLVTSSVTTILRQVGFDKIYYAYKPFDAIHQCRQIEFDLIICDYNFQTQLNGFQLLEELKYSKILSPRTVFMFLTGENEQKTVRSIVDSSPDDYLLKPFRKPFFMRRLKSTLKRKFALLPIYEKLYDFDYAGVVARCDELLPFHPEYAMLIRRYRAYALVQSKQFDLATTEYESLLSENNADWCRTALANTLIETDQIDRAHEVLSNVNNKQDNPYYHDEMSNIAVINQDLPKAIEHLKLSTMLLDAGAERELVVTNLSLATSSYDDAVTYIKRYYDKNQNTFRGGIFTKLNYVRCYLYRAMNNVSASSFENLLFGLNPMILELQKSGNLQVQSQLVSAHIAAIRGDLYTTVSEIKHVLSNHCLDHFYDLYHLCILLEHCSFLNEVTSLLPKVRRTIADSQHPSIFRSQIHMLKSLETRLQQSQMQVVEIRKDIASLTTISKSAISAHLDRYFQLHELLPNSKKICLAIIRLASQSPFEYKGEFEVYRKIDACDRVIKSLCDNDEIKRLNYLQIYKLAKDNIRVAA